MTEEDYEDALASKQQILDKCKDAINYHRSYMSDEQWAFVYDCLSEQIHTVLWD